MLLATALDSNNVHLTRSSPVLRDTAVSQLNKLLSNEHHERICSDRSGTQLTSIGLFVQVNRNDIKYHEVCGLKCALTLSNLQND